MLIGPNASGAGTDKGFTCPFILYTLYFVIVAQRIALDPNNKQKTYFAKACGVARFSYNWGLAEWKKDYEAWKADNSLPKPSAYGISKKLNAIKREQFPWMTEVTKCAPQYALDNLGAAFSNFFKGKARYPTFKRKTPYGSFEIANDQFRLDGCHVLIPKLGRVRMWKPLRFTGKILSGTVSRVADKWFLSVTLEVDEIPLRPRYESQGAVGVDVGLRTFATLSTGEKVEGAKSHKALLGRLRRLSRSLSRKQKGSKNRMKARLKVARLHARIGNIRADFLHKLTSRLVRSHDVIGIETLNVKGLLKNRHLARSISDASWFEFRRQLQYKAEWYGVKLVEASRFFPSSKTLHCCGVKLDDLSLSDRMVECPCCGKHYDRDVNAAINLKNLAAGHVVSACGEKRSGKASVGSAKRNSSKQERSKVHLKTVS